MPLQDLILATSKCILICIAWILLYFLLPSILDDQGLISTLLKCENELDVLLLCIMAFVTWFIVGICYLFMDYYYESKGVLNLKRIQYPQRNGLKQIDWSLINNAIHLSFINTFISIFAVTFIYTPLAKKRGFCNYDSIHNYNLFLTILKIPLLLFLTDIIFYSTHRVFHKINWLYTNIHKIHHQFVDTYSLSANACHPIEHIVTNLSSVLLPLMILNIPLYWSALYMEIASINSTFCHSGYVIFRTISPIPHDFHHHFLNIEFGAGKYCDEFFKTRLKYLYPTKYPLIIKPYIK